MESRTRKGNNFHDTFANRLLVGATLILQRTNPAFSCRSQSGSHTGTRLACVINIITALCPVAGSCATQGIIKVLIQCHHTFGRMRNLSLPALPFMTPRVCSGEFLKHFIHCRRTALKTTLNSNVLSHLSCAESDPSLPLSL